MPITLTLSPEYEALIDASVARGEFASPEEAVSVVLFRAMSLLEGPPIEDDPEQVELLKEALADAEAEAARGDVFSLEETLARMDQRRAARNES